MPQFKQTNHEVEQVLLGTIIVNSEVLSDVIPILSGQDVFSTPKYQMLYDELVAMFDDNTGIDLMTVVNRIKGKPLGKEFTAVKLSELTSKAEYGFHSVEHAQIVKEAYVRRKFIASTVQMQSAAIDGSSDVVDSISFANREMDSINEILVGNSQGESLRELAPKAVKEAENRQKKAGQGEFIGMPTGIAGLDKILGGWQPGNLYILAARPSMGKTAIMLHAGRTAAKHGYPGCMYTLEMSARSLTDRMLMSECDVDIDAFKRGTMCSKDWREIELAQVGLSKMPIHVNDRGLQSMRYIKAHATMMRRKGLCKWIVVDYLQLVETEKSGNREQEIAAASRQAKIIAKDLGIPVILLSQLNRSVEQRDGRKPILADLRESGAIEQDADAVIFIYRPAYYNIPSINSRSLGEGIPTDFYGQLIVAKQRDGAVGTAHFLHNESMTKIESYDTLRHRQLRGIQSVDVEHHYETDNEPF